MAGEAVTHAAEAAAHGGVDLTQVNNLIDIAEEAGLDTELIEALLNSNTGKLEIEMAEKELQNLGITSIPLYIFENKFAVSGAQSVEAFTKAFEEAVAMTRTDYTLPADA